MTALALRQGFMEDPAAFAAYATLLQEVFDIDMAARDRVVPRDPTCRPFAFFEKDGRCVASVEVFALPLVLDGERKQAAAIRAVAVHPDRRGQGLFRDLMGHALAWSDRAICALALLYTAEPALYTRFGFRDCAQHKFKGAPPRPRPFRRSARRLSMNAERDMAILQRLLATRSPVSHHVAVNGGSTPFMVQAIADASLILFYSEDDDAVIVVDADTEPCVILVDIVASVMPSLAAVLAALGRKPATVEVLFPPDQLAWEGRAESDDTGLMIRGTRPSAFDRPFMLPPTAEF